MEQRVFTDWYPWHLFRVGAAAFVDVGRAWGGHQGATSDGLDRLLADIGVGLRLGLSRSGRGSMLHLDLAHPLVHQGSFGHLQWLVSNQRSF